MSLTVRFLSETEFEIICRNHRIVVDQPKSEKGTDKGMTPVELLNASLASCAAYYATTFLKRHMTDLTGLTVESTWQYTEDPHRIGAMQIRIVFPSSLTKAEKDGLLRTVDHCTVENTLKHVPSVTIDVDSEED
jgi:putative redox protein